MTDMFQADQPKAIDPNRDYFVELVGEDKKYKTQQDAGRAIVEKELHIERLMSELTQARQNFTTLAEELQARKNAKEVEDRMNSLENSPQPTPDNQTGTGARTEADLENLIAAELNKRDAARTAAQNLAQAEAKAREVLGENYAASVQAKAQEIGVSMDFLKDVAAKSPAAFAQILGLSSVQPPKREGFTAPPQGQQGFSPRVSNDKNFAYFNKLRKEDPKTYNTPRIQMEMHRLAHEMGPDFFKE